MTPLIGFLRVLIAELRERADKFEVIEENELDPNTEQRHRASNVVRLIAGALEVSMKKTLLA